jgi:hypothetical protein
MSPKGKACRSTTFPSTPLMCRSSDARPSLRQTRPLRPYAGSCQSVKRTIPCSGMTFALVTGLQVGGTRSFRRGSSVLTREATPPSTTERHFVRPADDVRARVGDVPVVPLAPVGRRPPRQERLPARRVASCPAARPSRVDEDRPSRETRRQGRPYRADALLDDVELVARDELEDELRSRHAPRPTREAR